MEDREGAMLSRPPNCPATDTDVIGIAKACHPAMGRVIALVEVLLAFAVVHLTYRSFKHFTELGRMEGEAGLNFSPGAVMILFTVSVLLLARGFATYLLVGP